MPERRHGLLAAVTQDIETNYWYFLSDVCDAMKQKYVIISVRIDRSIVSGEALVDIESSGNIQVKIHDHDDEVCKKEVEAGFDCSSGNQCNLVVFSYCNPGLERKKNPCLFSKV